MKMKRALPQNWIVLVLHRNSVDQSECFFVPLFVFNSNNFQWIFWIYRKLKMCTLKEYEVPIEISQIERKKKLVSAMTAKEFASRFGLSTLNKSTERGYIDSFTKMLHFEEAAQSQFLTQFNTKGIQLCRSKSESAREFCIKNDVSVTELNWNKMIFLFVF